jgi:hypothetical protein
MDRKELWDGGAGALLEVGVEVKEVPANAAGEEATDGGLTRAHEASEDETADGGREKGVSLWCLVGFEGGVHFVSVKNNSESKSESRNLLGCGLRGILKFSRYYRVFLVRDAGSAVAAGGYQYQ